MVSSWLDLFVRITLLRKIPILMRLVQVLNAATVGTLCVQARVQARSIILLFVSSKDFFSWNSVRDPRDSRRIAFSHPWQQVVHSKAFLV